MGTDAAQIASETSSGAPCSIPRGAGEARLRLVFLESLQHPSEGLPPSLSELPGPAVKGIQEVQALSYSPQRCSGSRPWEGGLSLILPSSVTSRLPVS